MQMQGSSDITMFDWEKALSNTSVMKRQQLLTELFQIFLIIIFDMKILCVMTETTKVTY